MAIVGVVVVVVVKVVVVVVVVVVTAAAAVVVVVVVAAAAAAAAVVVVVVVVVVSLMYDQNYLFSYLIESDECLLVECLNGGRCVDGFKQYTCNCQSGYTGQLCETSESSII